jgi:UDP-3-O-[3-hydroxymyristoyl] glucosamine N-acyltransferase
MKILIYGTKSSAKFIAETISESHNFEILGFIGNEKESKELFNKKIFQDYYFLGTLKDVDHLKKLHEDLKGFIVGVGDPILKEDIYYELENTGLISVNAISNKSSIAKDVKIGTGTVVGNGSIISSGTIIGNNTFVGSNTTIEYGVNISDNCIIRSSCVIGASSSIMRCVSINSSSVIYPEINIGKNQQIDEGSVIKKDKKSLIKKSI